MSLNYKSIKFTDSQNRVLLISDFISELTNYKTKNKGIDLSSPAPQIDVVKTPSTDFAQIANISYSGRYIRINGRFIDFGGSANSTRDSITYLKSFERKEVDAEVYFGSDNITNSKKTYTIKGTITELSTLDHNQDNEYNFLLTLFSPTPYFFGETFTKVLPLGTGGRGYPKAYSYGYVPGGNLSVVNNGDTLGFTTIKINGPAQNITINANNSSFILGTGAEPFTIQDDEFITIDSQNQIVTTNNDLNITGLTNNIFDPFRVNSSSTLNLQVLASLTSENTEITASLQTPYIQID